MIYFASGVFSGWKHETFGGCFLDYAWLIQDELPQEEIGGFPYANSQREDRQINERRKRTIFKKRNAVLLVTGLV